MAINRRQIIKVTAISLLAVLITVFLFFMVFKVQLITGPYFYIHFEHVGSLTVGAVVRMAGVRIGTVSSIDINEEDFKTVIITVSLYPNQKVKDDSRFLIMSGSLIGDQYIEVLPGDSDTFISDGETFTGEPIKNLDSFLLSSDTLIKDFTVSMSILSEILRDNKGDIDKTLKNIRESTDGLTELLENLNSKDSAINLLNQKETRADLKSTIANLKEISENLVGVTAGLESIVDSVVGPSPAPSAESNR